MVWMITLALGGRLSHELAACMSYTEQALAERAACESNPPTTQYEGQTFTLPCPPLWPGADSAAVCSTAYREPGCRAAWFSADLDATTVVRACARDYCAVLPGKKPAACADPDLAEALDLPALDVAILRFEGLSRRDAEVIAQRLEPSLNQEYKEVVDSEDGVDAGGETGVDDVAAACGEAPGELGFDWVRIPGGRYPVGQHPTGERAPAALAPSFAEVESFELMNVEVPVHQHDACVELGACDARPEEPDCHAGATFPANCLSYRDAEALCRFLGGRLPTDIEWEVAARGAEGRTYPWGDAWFDGAFEHEDRKVGSCPVTDTPEGLHDMGGNVREWTSTATSDVTHVTRSMMCAELSCLAYNRFPGELDAARHAYLGVRGATSAPRLRLWKRGAGQP